METAVMTYTQLEVDKEGYLKHADEWTPDIAREIAALHNIELSEKHFAVVQWLRNRYFERVPLTIRRVGASGLVDIKTFYQLFPGGPLKISSKIAGIPKPVSCI
jgi:tRNA 2-thiouridine synthesizing protein E